MITFENSLAESATPNADFDVAFNAFFEGIKKISSDYMKRQFPNLPPKKFTAKKGKRYVKIIEDGGSVFCFVDATNGDVLKAASWSAPAKGARGNIFDNDHGLGRMGPYGPEYNR